MLFLFLILIVGAQANGFAGSFPALPTGNINLKNCQNFVNNKIVAGYGMINNNTQQVYCCIEKGLIYGDYCQRGDCGNPPILFLDYAYVTPSPNIFGCFVDCILTPATVNVSLVTSSQIYNGPAQALQTIPSYDSYIVLNGAFIPVYAFVYSNQGHACLSRGSYQQGQCTWTDNCLNQVVSTSDFFFNNSSCYNNCYPI